jgi:hypothetical protein
MGVCMCVCVCVCNMNEEKVPYDMIKMLLSYFGVGILTNFPFDDNLY